MGKIFGLLFFGALLSFWTWRTISGAARGKIVIGYPQSMTIVRRKSPKSFWLAIGVNAVAVAFAIFYIVHLVLRNQAG